MALAVTRIQRRMRDTVNLDLHGYPTNDCMQRRMPEKEAALHTHIYIYMCWYYIYFMYATTQPLPPRMRGRSDVHLCDFMNTKNGAPLRRNPAQHNISDTKEKCFV